MKIILPPRTPDPPNPADPADHLTGVADDGSEAFVLKARRVAGVARIPVPIPRRLGCMAKRTAQARILIYSHDSFGLGHLRRCRTIAHSLVSRHSDLSVMILSGS